MKVEEERRVIRVMTRREAGVANLSRVLDSDQLLYEYACARINQRSHTHTHTHKGEKNKRKRGDASKGLFDPRRDASSCCASLSISNEGCG